MLKVRCASAASSVIGPGHPGWVLTVGQGARAVILGLVCTLVFAILARTMLAHQLRDALGVAPAKIRGPVRRLLRL